MISDKRLLELINNRETKYVEFKIKCEAFASSNLQPKAELVKDICALANNGNVSNYLIIGVSNDGTQFESVKNIYLQDEKIQELCLKSISPPPKIRVVRKKYRIKVDESQNVELVIIQVGPHKRQAFRLIRDFIDNKEKVYFRRNEVWIRRGTIVDTATPEEVARLVAGKEPLESPADNERNEERLVFEGLSQFEKCEMITDSIPVVFKNNKLHQFSVKDIPKMYRFYRGEQLINSYVKEFPSFLAFIDFSECFEKLINRDFLLLSPDIYRDTSTYSDFEKKLLTKFPNTSFLRRLHIIPVLPSISKKRLQDNFRSWKWSGNSLYFFRPDSGIQKYQNTSLQISTEFVFVDNIISVSDFCERLDEEIRYFLSYDLSKIFSFSIQEKEI